MTAESTTTIVVSSTEDGTGKTAIAIALAKLASEHGASVGYMKPKGTRLESAVGKTLDQDPMLAREVLDLDAEMHQLEPIVYSPTFITEVLRGRENPDSLRESVRTNFEELAADVDVMVLEGGGRLSTGAIVELTDQDIADLLDAEMLLVSHFDEARDIDDVFAAAKAVGDRLAGVIYNDISSSEFDVLTEDVMPFLDSHRINSLGYVPSDELLSGVTVQELTDELGATLLTPDVNTGNRVERFSVGAMGGESALEQLRRTRKSAVITGGDRSDVQAAALQASGVECLVLTGGYRPSNAIIGRATEEDLPILLVQSDTRVTIDRVEGVLRSGRTQRVETVERMAEHLESTVDIASLFGLDSS